MQAFRLIGHYLFLYAGTGIYLPFLPLFLATAGLDSAQIGYLLAISPLTGIFAQVMWGNLADRQNRRKEYLILTVAGMAVVCFFLPAAKGIAGFALLLFLYAFFNSAVTPLTDSLALNVLADTRQFGEFRRWGSLGFAVTAASGGVLFTVLPIKEFGFLAGSLFLLTLGWVFTLPNPRHCGIGQARGSFPVGQVLATEGVLPFLGVVLLIMVPYNVYISFMGWHLQHLGASRAWIGLSWTVAAVSEIPVFGFGAIWLKKIPAKSLMAMSAVVYAMRWLAYAVIPSYGVIVWIQVSQSLSFALFYLAAVEYLARLVPANLRSSAQGLFQAAAFGVSAVLGAAGGGWVLKHSNLSVLYMSMAAAALAGALGAFALCRQER